MFLLPVRIHGIHKDHHLFKYVLPFHDQHLHISMWQKKSHFFLIVLVCNPVNHAVWHAAQNLGPCFVTEWFQELTLNRMSSGLPWHLSLQNLHIPDSKVHGANRGPIWGWQDSDVQTKFTLDATWLTPHHDWSCLQYLPLKLGPALATHHNILMAILFTQLIYKLNSDYTIHMSIHTAISFSYVAFVNYTTIIALSYQIQHLF